MSVLEAISFSSDDESEMEDAGMHTQEELEQFRKIYGDMYVPEPGEVPPAHSTRLDYLRQEVLLSLHQPKQKVIKKRTSARTGSRTHKNK